MCFLVYVHDPCDTSREKCILRSKESLSDFSASQQSGEFKITLQRKLAVFEKWIR